MRFLKKTTIFFETMISHIISIAILGFTAHQRIRNSFLQVVRGTFLHLFSLAGPTGNFGDFTEFYDLGLKNPTFSEFGH